MHYLLFYDYVDDIAARRTPYRPAHLELVDAYLKRGELEMAGAFDSPLDGALFVFRGEGPAAAEAFVREDPYAAAGLVTAWRIRRWNVVTGTRGGS